METLAATANYTAPHAQTSHLRESRSRNLPAVNHHNKNATRPFGDVQPVLSAPASQESFVSVQSAGSSVALPKLQASDSNLSQLTSYTDTDPTSPSSSAASKLAQDAAHTSTTQSQIPRQRTPEHAVRMPYPNGDNALTSPMSITSPATTNGAKRTASGHVKNTPSLSNTPYTSHLPGRDSRRDSISSSGSRAGELAATLKTRLGYAMAKVQHGWEHKTLPEVEQLAAQRARSNRHSMSHLDQHRPGTSGLSIETARMSMYENDLHRERLDAVGPPPSKRHSGNYGGLVQSASYSLHSNGAAPRLQPPADIRYDRMQAISYAPRHSHYQEHFTFYAPFNDVDAPLTERGIDL
ncbi:Hypothetical predicted protein [Lecanosticta acicola]|uniref:Uncharacterized protein n=1 Tax=Lecanosticta acicola TaxID=111012 RepID=A0AAI9EF06_9PEZI|nr:Hypothetical predicted protein [Lecanosticta acicola]